ncbi:MAG: Holliday junction resolvase RuvX [Gammaproteobacteria bacterium]
MTVLGFDFGERRIGVAVGHTLTGTAGALKCLHARARDPDWVAIGQLIACWQPEALIVGIPVNLDGSEHRFAGCVVRFCRQLQGRFGLPVHTIDETLSSVEANRHPQAVKRRGVDAVAAQLILESWLNERSRRDEPRKQ